MTGSSARAARYWLPVAAWLVLITLESTELMSTGNTSGVLFKIAALFGYADRHVLLLLDLVIRKVGHFLGYGILCLLVFRALQATFAGTLRRWALFAISSTFLVASLDEIHQSFLPSRGGHMRDVALDTTGAVCVLLLVFAFMRIRKNRGRENEISG